MRLFHGTDNADIARPTVVTLGVFDGLHLGHQLIMQTVVERARASGAVPTVITFEPHPRALLHPESAPPLLQTFDQKIEALGVLGIEQTIVIRFDKDFAQIRAEDFLRDVIAERLHAKEVYLGRGFAFGHDRQGRVSVARRMLGRPYGVEGRVVRGAERGGTLGFPTANLHPQNRVIPSNGVYVTATLIEGQWRRSVTNIGTKPTFGANNESSVETFVMDWSGDLYGDVVRVRFLHRLREEKKFNSIDELKSQIKSDVVRAGSYFEHGGVKNSLSVV
jgi:riboflavin kinase/FMN adenylyltransferase